MVEKSVKETVNDSKKSKKNAGSSTKKFIKGKKKKTAHFGSNSEHVEECLFTYKIGRKKPVLMTCPNCRSAQTTTVTYVCTRKTHLVACALTPLLLCWIPYCTTVFKKARHNCSVCAAFIGISA